MFQNRRKKLKMVPAQVSKEDEVSTGNSGSKSSVHCGSGVVDGRCRKATYGRAHLEGGR